MESDYKKEIIKLAKIINRKNDIIERLEIQRKEDTKRIKELLESLTKAKMIEKELIINGIKVKANVPDSWLENDKVNGGING